ncbi:MAG: PspC domain-containing protein [Terriglobales bacterium]
MYCNACGQVIPDDSRFCSHCGHSVGHAHPTRLIRPRFDRKIAGVCAGVAHHLDLDVTMVRILWVFVTLAAGLLPGVIAYVIAWIVMPEEPLSLPAPVGQPQQPVAG